MILIWMNLYIWSHSTDKYDTKEYMKFQKKWCILFMTYYTYDDYVYFNNSIDALKVHHNKLILNQEPYFLYNITIKVDVWDIDIVT